MDMGQRNDDNIHGTADNRLRQRTEVKCLVSIDRSQLSIYHRKKNYGIRF